MSARAASLSLLLTASLLTACATTTVVTDEEKAPVMDDTEFTGDHTMTMDASQSVISFEGRSNIINHECKFNSFDVTITTDLTDPSDLEKATIVATIDVDSVETDSDGLTGHLKRPDFFDAEQYPQVTFTSTEIVKKSGNTYAVTGDLTIKGTTKSVTIDADITDSGLSFTYDLPRKDFSIGNDSYGDKLLDPLVPVTAKVVFEK